MGSLFAAVRRSVIVPPLAEVSFTRRGFVARDERCRKQLETVPRAVLCGLEWGLEADVPEVADRLPVVAAEHRGFVVEGVTMAYTLRDAMRVKPFGRRRLTAELLAGPGRPHLLLAYIGIGFAMAKLPRRLWPGLLPELPEEDLHPALSWLAVDGYGFDRAFFDPDRWLGNQQMERSYPWLGDAHYFHRAFDQGVGRACWFVDGGRPEAVAARINAFASRRHQDLWSGVGLAASVAGGVPPETLKDLVARAADRAVDLGVGAILAAVARSREGHVPTQCDAAIGILSGLSVADATALAEETRPHLGPGYADGQPPYELWRSRLRLRLATTTHPELLSP